ncbi:MAG: class I SAM-dependent methyltransferase [Pseudomonadota bacterium]
MIDGDQPDGAAPGSDPGTLDFYDHNAEAYAACAETEDGLRHLALFAADLPPGGRVLDLGAGEGWAAGWLAGEGFQAVAYDASESLLALAAARPGVETRLGTFEELDAYSEFDGIWASFSLLHAPRASLPGNLSRIATALIPGGRLFVGLKEGDYEERDRLGRFYAYFTVDEVLGALRDTGFEVLQASSAEGKGMTGEVQSFLYFHARLAP